MKPEIQKILEMTQAGTITAEQAAQLLEKLGAGAEAPRATGAEAPRGWGDFIQNFTTGALNSAGVGPADGEGNRIQLSKMDPPRGQEFVFEDNTIALSKVTRVELTQAEMARNTINASRLEHLTVLRGKLLGAAVNGSALDRITVEGSVLEGLGVGASKVDRLTVRGESRVNGLRLDMCKASELVIEGGVVEDLTFHALKISELELVRSTLKDVKFMAGESWRSHGLSKSRLESCNLERTTFVDCRLKGTVLRNVELREPHAPRPGPGRPGDRGDRGFPARGGSRPARARCCRLI